MKHNWKISNNTITRKILNDKNYTIKELDSPFNEDPDLVRELFDTLNDYYSNHSWSLACLPDYDFKITLRVWNDDSTLLNLLNELPGTILC